MPLFPGSAEVWYYKRVGETGVMFWFCTRVIHCPACAEEKNAPSSAYDAFFRGKDWQYGENEVLGAKGCAFASRLTHTHTGLLVHYPLPTQSRTSNECLKPLINGHLDTCTFASPPKRLFLEHCSDVARRSILPLSAYYSIQETFHAIKTCLRRHEKGIWAMHWISGDYSCAKSQQYMQC